MELLWISAFSPYTNSGSAGSKTFEYYFKHVVSMPDFSVSLLSIDWYQKTKAADYDWSNFKSCKRFKILYNDGSVFEKGKNFVNKFNLLDPMQNLVSPLVKSRIFSALQEWKNDGYRPNIIILEWTNMVVLADDIKKLFPNAKLVASEHDVTYVGYKRKANYYSGLKSFFWKEKYKREKKTELSALEMCDLILPHNPDNTELLVGDGVQKEKIMWLTPYFHNFRNVNRTGKYKKRDILFFGAMSRPENYLSVKWFLEQVMPRLADVDVCFVILGSNPPEELKTYQSERVIITGFVDDPTPFFAQSLCLVAPLVLGAGIKVKVIEGLSAGIPVLTNSIGIEGIAARDSVEYCHCETPEQYEQCIRKVLAGELDDVGENGGKFVEQKYDLKQSADSYVKRLRSMGNDSDL